MADIAEQDLQATIQAWEQAAWSLAAPGVCWPAPWRSLSGMVAAQLAKSLSASSDGEPGSAV